MLKKSVEDAFREKNAINESLRIAVLEKEQLNNDITNLSGRISDLQNELKLRKFI